MSERGFVTSSEDGNVGLDFPVRTTDTLRERSRAPAITGLCAIRKALDMIALTDTATTKVAELIKAEGEDGLALRVAVRPGGCSGFSYEMFFDSEFADDDKVEEYGDVRLVCDEASAGMLVGATLDYTESIQETGFKINNPNAQRTCGCGSSFS